MPEAIIEYSLEKLPILSGIVFPEQPAENGKTDYGRVDYYKRTNRHFLGSLYMSPVEHSIMGCMSCHSIVSSLEQSAHSQKVLVEVMRRQWRQ